MPTRKAANPDVMAACVGDDWCDSDSAGDTVAEAS
jgi:hypothetical protein